MDIFAIRRWNLAILLERMKENGTKQKDQALALDLSPSHLSQLVSGKNIGEDVSRKIEKAQRLPIGWLDAMQSPMKVFEASADYNTPSQSLRFDPQTIAAATRLVRLTFRNLDVEFDIEEDGVPLVLAYEYLLARQERVVTPDNLVDFSKKLAEKMKDAEHAERSESNGGVGSSDRGPRSRRKA